MNEIMQISVATITKDLDNLDFTVQHVFPGSYANSYKVVKDDNSRHHLLPQVVKVKCYPYISQPVELQIWSSVSHRNLITLNSHIRIGPAIYFFHPLYESNLEDYLKNFLHKDKFLSKEVLLKWSYQLLTAVDYLHNVKEVVHFDIKPSNIFLEYNNILLGNFGKSRIVPEVYFSDNLDTLNSEQSRSDNLFHMRRAQISKSIDMWQVGETMFFMATKKTWLIQAEKINWLELNKLFELETKKDPRIEMVLAKLRLSEIVEWDFVSLLSVLLLNDSKLRFSAQCALEHKYFSESKILRRSLRDKSEKRRSLLFDLLDKVKPN